MTSRTSLSWAPSLPPGWKTRKCSAVKPRCSSRATASASPRASCMVVEVVGASPFGQASCARRQDEADVRLPPERRGSARGDGDERNAEALRIGDEVGKLRRLAGPGQGDDHVVRPHHAEIAVARLGGMHVMGRRAGRGEGGGDLARDVARLAHAGDDDAALGMRRFASTASANGRRRGRSPIASIRTPRPSRSRRQSVPHARTRQGARRRGRPFGCDGPNFGLRLESLASRPLRTPRQDAAGGTPQLGLALAQKRLELLAEAPDRDPSRSSA